MKLKIGLLFVLISMLVSCDTEESQKEIKVMEYNDSSEYIAIFGDIQYYTYPAYFYLYQHSCDWILYQKHAGMKINDVLLVGDVTNKNEVYQWEYFRNATRELANEIPYISVTGDHDYTWDGNTIYDRNSTHFSEYLSFPLTKQKVVAWFEEGHMENIIVENYIHGIPIYFLALEFGPRKEVVSWANEFVKNHPDIYFILINHEYLEAGGGRRTEGLKCVLRLKKNTNTTYTTPTQLWNQLIKNNDNILCVLCGHVSSLYAYTPEENDFGREVPQIQHNIQGSAYRYDNWLMLWEFPLKSDTVNVSIINTNTLKYFNNSSTLFKFKYRR